MVMQSAVLILPSELKTQGDQIGEAMGWGAESYTIQLSNSSEITHYGLRADVSQQFVNWITTRENLPGIPNLITVLDNLIYDFSGTEHTFWGREHLDYACNQHNLTVIGV
jgi:hypothetical protein